MGVRSVPEGIRVIVRALLGVWAFGSDNIPQTPAGGDLPPPGRPCGRLSPLGLALFVSQPWIAQRANGG